MSVAGMVRPEVDSEAEVTADRHGVPVSARVEVADDGGLVVRPSTSDFVEDSVVRVGDRVRVFWRDEASGWALQAEVATVEQGAAPRWHLAVAGPAEQLQRREAVRARVTLPVVAALHGSDLEGQTLDLSEAGARVTVEGYGMIPEPGSRLDLTLTLDGGSLVVPAEVVRHQARGARWTMSLRFHDLPERDQDRLRRRVFQALREERARSAD